MKNWIIITGATGSMGRVAVKSLAQEGYPVIMACRNLKKGEDLLEEILKACPAAVLELHKLDLMAQASVYDFVNGLCNKKIEGLFNNAGVISRAYNVTEDGFEQTMAVNYLNPALLTRLLVPHFVSKARIVNMVSLTTKFATLDLDWRKLGSKDFSRLKIYSSSKLAFLYFSIAFAKRHPEFVVNVSDPGIVDSNMISMGRWYDPIADIVFRPLISSPDKGVKPALAALHASESLKYYVGKKSDDIPSHYVSSPLVDSLWDQATEFLGLHI